MRYIIVVSSLLMVGCINSADEQYIHCQTICQYPADNCNSFILEDCIFSCVELNSSNVTIFEACVECYVDVYCDLRAYQILCYPECEF